MNIASHAYLPEILGEHQLIVDSSDMSSSTKCYYLLCVLVTVLLDY